MGVKDLAPPSSQIYGGDGSLLFNNGKMFVIAHQWFIRIWSLFKTLFPFIPFVGPNFHEPFSENSHQT
jgi:hypothetical protein